MQRAPFKESWRAYIRKGPASSMLRQLHPPYLGLVRILVQTIIQIVPPFEQHGIANQLKPWREFKAAILEHCPQLFLRDVSRILDFIRVWVVVDIGFDHENVVNCRMSDRSIPRSMEEGRLHFHALPIYRHLVLCNVFASET